MQPVKLLNLIAYVALAGLVPASQAARWTGHASVSFIGDSTLHHFKGHGEAEPFTVTTTELASTGAPRMTCHAVVKVGNLTTDNKSRDKNMFEMFRVADFPVLEGTLRDVESGASDMPLTITILGKEQTITAKATDWTRTATKQSFTLTFDVSLAGSGLQAPRAAAGLIKVRDLVAVTIHVELLQEQETP